MTISTLDTKMALLVVDLQKGIVGLPTAHPMAEVLANTVKLLGAFRGRSLPVVLINVAGGAPGRIEQSRARMEMRADWADLVPELDQQPSDHVVTKRTWGAFTGTGLEQYLRQAGVTQVVIAGVATSSGVESTARHGYELGFNIALAVDAMTDLSAEAHDYSIRQIFPRLGETGTAQQIADLVQGGNVPDKT
jgi:nicotinamidase-related amidase